MSEERDMRAGRKANEEGDVEGHVRGGRNADESPESDDVEAHLKGGGARHADETTGGDDDVEAHVKGGRQH